MRKKTVSGIILISLLCGTIVFLLLPFIANNLLLPQILDRLPFVEGVASISSISPYHIRGNLSSGEQNEGIRLPSVEIQYSIKDLLKGKISALLLEGASVHADMKNGTVILRGVKQKQDASPENGSGFSLILPISVDTLSMRNSTIILHRNNAAPVYLRVNGRMNITYEDVLHGSKIQSLEGRFSGDGPLNLQMEFTTNVDDHDLFTTFDVVCDDLKGLSSFSDFGLFDTVSGKGSLAGHFEMDVNGENITYQAAARLENFILRRGLAELSSSSQDTPLEVKVGGDLKKADFSVTSVALSTPQKSSAEIAASYNFSNKELKGEIKIIPELLQAPVVTIFNGRIREGNIAADYSFEGDGFQLRNGLRVDSFAGKGNVRINKGGAEGNLLMSFPGISLSENELTISNLTANFILKDLVQASVNGISGNVVIETISYKGRAIAKINTSVAGREEGLALDALVTTPLHDKAEVFCDSIITLEKNISLSCTLKEVEIDTQQIPAAIPIPAELSLTGKISGALFFEINGGIPLGKASIDYRDGHITYKQSQLSDISLDLTFPYLPRIQSGPGQICTIGTIDLGNIKMSDARIQLRIDDSSTLFIEKAKMHWCGGRVETGALTLFQGMQKLETTLYCDRLGYTELLGQLGIGEAEGEGALNGRLPINIDSHGITFDDGFLFSTPGSGGIVRFKNTDQLRRGMAGVEQNAYIDYSLKALENFSYNWTKLRFTTDKEELLLSLQLDGKPAEPLPYGYQQGQLVKKTNGSGLQHPIRLDVNFRLPMNDMFRYGKSIQSLMEKM